MSKRITVGASVSLGAIFAAPAVAQAEDFQVTNLNDSGSGSLRQAIQDSNDNAGADRVLFASKLSGTIELVAPQLPGIYDSLQIVGPGARLLRVHQDDPEVDVFGADGGDVEISGLTISGGEDGILPYNSSLDLARVTISGASESGVSVVNSGVTVTSSTIAANGEEGMQLIDGSQVTVENSTISGNLLEGGFQLRSQSELTLRSSTITANRSAYAAGGIDADQASEVDLSGAIVAANSGAGPHEDLEDGSLDSDFSAAFSLIGDPGNSGITSAGGNLIGVDPKLKPLKDNGGPTDTHAFKKSPAKNAGPSDAPDKDQRGAPRKGKADIGAYELSKCKGVIVNRVGTSGKDKLKGTKRKDGMLGLGGNDKLKGKKGKDGLCGGRGKDKLIGGPGKDKFNGGPGKDREKQ